MMQSQVLSEHYHAFTLRHAPLAASFIIFITIMRGRLFVIIIIVIRKKSSYCRLSHYFYYVSVNLNIKAKV